MTVWKIILNDGHVWFDDISETYGEAFVEAVATFGSENVKEVVPY